MFKFEYAIYLDALHIAHILNAHVQRIDGYDLKFSMQYNVRAVNKDPILTTY